MGSTHRETGRNYRQFIGLNNTEKFDVDKSYIDSGMIYEVILNIIILSNT